jgi:predicted transcriptional regulator
MQFHCSKRIGMTKEASGRIHTPFAGDSTGPSPRAMESFGRLASAGIERHLPPILPDHFAAVKGLPAADGSAKGHSGPYYCMGRIAGTLTTVNRLGELERAIMDVLWDTHTSLTVREVSARLTERNLAHTTVMTVLDRLAKKGFARRERDGRAWRYCPAATRETYVTELMLTALDQTGDRTAALTRFAQSVSGVEAEVLRDALEVIEGSGEGDDGT